MSHSTLDSPPSVLADSLRRALGDLLDAVLERHGEWLSLKDAVSGSYLHVNRALAEAFGSTPAQMIGRTDTELLTSEQARAMRAADQTALAHGQPLATEHRFDAGGQARLYAVLRSVTEIDGRQVLCAVWSDLTPQQQRESQLRAALAQIEEQQLANDQLRYELTDQAVRDPVSGLHRRAHFEDQLRRELDLSSREHREFAIAFIELDPAGPDVLALGPEGNRRVLEAVGRLLRSGTRAMDAACRSGEGRFAVLLSGVGLATAHARMESLRRRCASEIVVQQGAELGFTVSMGVASFPHTAVTQLPLTEACEAALAEAQRRGGDHVRLAAIRFDAEVR